MRNLPYKLNVPHHRRWTVGEFLDLGIVRVTAAEQPVGRKLEACADMLSRCVVQFNEWAPLPVNTVKLDWAHVGGHHRLLAQDFFNFQLAVTPKVRITFSDSPDFRGEIPADPLIPGPTIIFEGDIGECGLNTFRRCLTTLYGMMWITVQPGRLILIEPLDYLNKL